MSLSFGSSKKTTNTTSQTDPWAETIPDLTNLLSRLRTTGTGAGQLTPTQTNAVAELQANAGNPWQTQIAGLADDMLGARSRAPQIEDAYSQLHEQLTPYATGTRVNPNTDPNMQALLTQVGDDAQNRINSMFAGAGRDLSGRNQQSVARGVNQAQLPILVDTYQRNQDRQIAASTALHGSGASDAVQEQNLDAAALGTRAGAIPVTDAAIQARDQGANARLNLEQQIKMLPVTELGQLAQILFGAAGLGNQQQGESVTRGTQTGFGVSAMDIGKLLMGLPNMGTSGWAGAVGKVGTG